MQFILTHIQSTIFQREIIRIPMQIILFYIFILFIFIIYFIRGFYREFLIEFALRFRDFLRAPL
jgi:hypothetical protein